MSDFPEFVHGEYYWLHITEGDYPGWNIGQCVIYPNRYTGEPMYEFNLAYLEDCCYLSDFDKAIRIERPAEPVV